MKLFILLTLISFQLKAERFIVEADKAPLLPKNVKFEAFYPSKHIYFSKLFVASGPVTKEQLLKTDGIRSVEETSELNFLSLVPAKNSEFVVADELFNYQWGLYNQGQTFYKEKDDIHNLPIKGVIGKDIGAKNFLHKSSTKKLVIAVLDSGVDLNHPEIQENLWRNEKECGKSSDVDNDGNKLKGDCFGWNFTEAIDSEEAKNPQDNDGHGTHVAGIIAAGKNGKGIVGVVPNALIMPIKVMKDSSSRSEISSSEAFAKGILYAVDQGAQIINMSLGWPRSLETKYLREAVLYALSQGVVIVAAAGNNNSSEPLFPCSYEGVICVGASTLSGDFARFSNFGGHVDTVAPGEGILSLHPTLFEPDYFSIPGYELRSGTSQSAPFVSGLIGALLSENPELRIDDIFAKIYSAGSSENQNKYILGGEANYQNFLKPVNAPVLRPIFKRWRQVVVRGNKSRIIIPVRNFGLPSDVAEVTLRAQSKGLLISSEAQIVPALNKGEGIELSFDAEIIDFNDDHLVTFEVSITEGNQTLQYKNEIPIVRDIRGESTIRNKKIQFKNESLPLGGFKNNELYSFVNTVESFGPSKKHEFFLRRILKEAPTKDLEITLFSKTGETYIQASKLILVPYALNLVNFVRVDMNFDGNEDYLVQVLCEKEGKKYFHFSFYNHELNPLWSDFPSASLDLNTYVQSLNELSFLTLLHPTLGKIYVPAFFTEGKLPLIDQVVTSWDKPDNTKKNRLYYLEPFNSSLRLRSATTNLWEESIKKSLGLKWNEDVQVEQLLPVSSEDLAEGSLRLLVSAGIGSKRKIFITKFTTQEIRRGLPLPQLVLQTENILPLLQLNQDGFSSVGEVYFNIYDRERSKIVSTSSLNQIDNFIFKNSSEDDVIVGQLGAFAFDSELISILETREELIWVARGSENIVLRKPKIRYSFLSQKLLAEMYSPVIIKNSSASVPALYADMTSVTGNRISVLEALKGKLTSSMKNSLSVPSFCKALDPQFNMELKVHEFILLCNENNEWIIKTLPMGDFEGTNRLNRKYQ
jgi:cell wall-associated protease